MPSVEGLQEVEKLNQMGNAGTQQLLRQQAAQQAASLFKSGDIRGALSTMAKVDPDHVGQLIAQFQQNDPETQQGLAQGKALGNATGELEGQTPYGANPRQMLDTQFSAQKEMAQMKANKEPSDKEKRLGNQFNQQMAFKYQQAAEGSPVYKSAIGIINEMPQLKALLDDAYKNGGQSLAMLGPRIAKGLAGEVGVLTEQDVTRYVSNPSLARSILSKGEKAYEGKLTATDYANLVRLGTVMQQKAEEKLNKAYEQAAKKMSRNLGIPEDEAMLLVNPTIDETSKSIISEHVNSLMPDPNKEALDWIKANPKDPRVPAIKQKLGIK